MDERGVSLCRKTRVIKQFHWTEISLKYRGSAGYEHSHNGYGKHWRQDYSLTLKTPTNTTLFIFNTLNLEEILSFLYVMAYFSSEPIKHLSYPKTFETYRVETVKNHCQSLLSHPPQAASEAID